MILFGRTRTITVAPSSSEQPRRVPHPNEFIASHVACNTPVSILKRPSKYSPISKDKQLESDLWLLRLGSPSVSQLDRLPGNATGLPSVFEHHPFRFIDFKAQAEIRKQAVQRSAVRTIKQKQKFYMDFGFMRASTSNFSQADMSKDHVVLSNDGVPSYLLIVNEASRYICVFHTKSKDPPIDIISAFLRQHGLNNSGCICINQGGKLARSDLFCDNVLHDFHYTVEPTGSNSLLHNGAVEIYNDKFGIHTRALLYGSGLPVQFWSAALLLSVFLHNRLAHSETKKTPFEGYYGTKPDLSGIKVFWSRVCVRQSGKHRAKLDRHDFTGIFLGYAATSQNIIYLDLNTGVVKTSHHAQFDEAWYLKLS
jgi:hypothetical protein